MRWKRTARNALEENNRGPLRRARCLLRSAKGAARHHKTGQEAFSRRAPFCASSSESFESAVETVADPGLSGDKLGVVGIGFDLFSQIADEDPQVGHLIAVVGPPDSLQEFAVSHGFVGVAGEVAHQVELLGGEMAGANAIEGRAGGEIDDQFAYANARRGRLRRRWYAAKSRANAS